MVSVKSDLVYIVIVLASSKKEGGTTMRLLRKALSICLSLAMVLAIFPALVVRAEIAELDTFTNINGTGISGVLYSDGRLVLSGNAKNGNFSLSSELKADTRLKYVDFSATTGIVTLNGGGFAGASIERFDFPESVKTVGSGLLQKCRVSRFFWLKLCYRIYIEFLKGDNST